MAKKTPRLTHFREIRISNKEETEYSEFFQVKDVLLCRRTCRDPLGPYTLRERNLKSQRLSWAMQTLSKPDKKKKWKRILNRTQSYWTYKFKRLITIYCTGQKGRITASWSQSDYPLKNLSNNERRNILDFQLEVKTFWEKIWIQFF